MKIKSIKKVILKENKQYYDVVNAYPYNNFLVKTNSGFICSHNCFFDEISFLKNQDINIQKKKAMDMIDTAIGGMKTRFIHNGKNPTLLVVASSKRSEQSFMESYIKLLSETSANNTYVVDKPVWEVKPEGTYSKEIFYIGLGDKYKETKVIPDGADLQTYKEQGYQIIEVPIDFKENALKDLNRMLCDYAGISSFSSNKFISAARLVSVVTDKFENPMPDVIEVGDAIEDEVEYSKFFNMEKVPKELKTRPLFIHLDMSVSGDKTGIAGVWIIGKKPTSDGNPGKDLWFQPAFSFSVQAPHGRQISFAKNRNFIRWLRDQGFKIKHITSDTFQSYNLQQDLKSDGFECSILSVDRVETIPGEHVGICKPYEYLKNTIYEGRIRLYKTELLYNELVQLEKDNNTGKVDHPPKGCFTGNTKVSLVDGRQLTFLELIDEYNQGKENYVYSMNLDTHKIEAKKIKKAWKTLENQPLIKVTLDNGEYIECTLNHKFMLRDGTYIEAQDLIPGDSLMPLYTKVSQKGLQGYRMYYEPFEDAWHYEHREFAKDILDEKYLVHHLDFNKLNLDRSHRGPWSNRYRQKKYELLNHKVVSIELLDRREDVYDIEVEDNHNFALASGVFVHNSKDQADAICGATYTASNYAEEYAFDYGENLDLLVDINKDEALDAKDNLKQVTINYEDELRQALLMSSGLNSVKKEEDDDGFFVM